MIRKVRKVVSLFLLAGIVGACIAPTGAEDTGTAAQPLLANLTTLRNRGYCMDVYAFNRDNGYKTLDLWDCNGLPNQDWDYNTETHEIVARFSGKCLENYDFDDNSVGMWDCWNGPNQKWRLLPSGQIQNERDGKCIRAQWFTHSSGDGCRNCPPAFLLGGCGDSDWGTYESFDYAWWNL